jgi:hypothetical protein
MAYSVKPSFMILIALVLKAKQLLVIMPGVDPA